MLEQVVERIVLLDEMLVVGWKIFLDEGKIVLAQHLHVKGSVQRHCRAGDFADGIGRIVRQEPGDPFTAEGDALG